MSMDSDTPMSDDDNKVADRICRALNKTAESAMNKLKCESVIIIATVSNGRNESIVCKGGAGNYYAQLGSTKVWYDNQ